MALITRFKLFLKNVFCYVDFAVFLYNFLEANRSSTLNMRFGRYRESQYKPDIVYP